MAIATRSTPVPIALLFCLLSAASSAEAQGAFSFVAGAPFPTPTNASQVFALDLDADGIDDLVTFSQPDTLWLPGDGLGGFGPAQVLLPFVVNSIAAADLDGDGLIDLAISDTGGLVSIRLANPTGGYTLGDTFDAGLPFPEVALGDFDGDGFLDVCFVRNAGGGTAQFAAFPGTGSGTFSTTPIIAPIDANPNELHLVDLDADGDLDAVTGHIGAGLGSSTFNVVRGNGLGGAEPAQSFPLPGLCTGITSGDLDEDGLEDLIVSALTITSFCGPNAFVHRQTPTGFVQTTEISGACGPHELLLADFDLDGHLDLLATDGGDLIAAVNWFDLHRGVGDGTFEPPQLIVTVLSGTGTPALIDADLDGRIDVALPGFGAEVQLFENETPVTGASFRRGDVNADGSVQAIADAVFLLTWGFQGGAEPPCFATADTNGDGAVTPIADAVYLLLWQFAGGTAPPAPFPDCSVEPVPGGLDCSSYPAGGCP